MTVFRTRLGPLAVALLLVVAATGDLAAEVREATLKLADIICSG